MVFINTVNSDYFELNGKRYAKIYQPLTFGTLEIGIYNAFDTRQQILSSTLYDEVSVDSTLYGSQAALVAALLPVVWKFDVLGATTTLWGEISGLLSNQTDLQSALNGKASTSHTHLIANVTDFTDNSTNWNTAFGWGNHATAGYLNTDQTTPQTVSNGAPIFSGGLEAARILFDTNATPLAGTPGLLQWNEDEDTLDLTARNGVTYQLGQEIAPLIRNNTGATIADGTPVMFSGTLGASGRVTVTPAIADGSIKSSYILGITTQEILSGQDGHVATFGKIRGLDTTGTPYGQVWNEGDLLYVSATTAGFLTNVKPEAPNAQIFVGVIINVHAQNGTIFTRSSWRGNLEDLDDVNGTPLTTTGQIMVWDETQGYFDFTSNISDFAPTNHTHLIADVTDFTDNSTNWDTAFSWGDHAGLYSLLGHTHLLAAGATDVTATAAEVNLLDLAGLTPGWVLSADTATTASWKAPEGGGVTDHGALTGLADNDHPQYVLKAGDTMTGNLNFGVNNVINFNGKSQLFGGTVATAFDLLTADLIIQDNAVDRFTFGRTTGNFTATGTGSFGNNLTIDKATGIAELKVTTDDPTSWAKLNIAGDDASFNGGAVLYWGANQNYGGGVSYQYNIVDSQFTGGNDITSFYRNDNGALEGVFSYSATTNAPVIFNVPILMGGNDLTLDVANKISANSTSMFFDLNDILGNGFFRWREDGIDKMTLNGDTGALDVIGNISAPNAVTNETDTFGTKASKIVTLTQVEYDGLTPDANTLYFIT